VTDTHIQLAKQHSFLAGLPEEYVERLLSLGMLAHFRPEQFIFREGDQSSFFYVVISGTVALEVTTPGRTLRIQTLGPGDELGWTSLLSSVEKQFQARALEHAEAIAFDGALLRQACEDDPAFGYRVMRRVVRLVAGRLQATRLQLVDMYSHKSAREVK
jgi:CRP/FNR family transcriptional regulator, cyclic AMP receptor protein